MLKLDLVQTVAFSGIILFIGYGMRRLIPVLAKYNLPAPVLGGLLVAIFILVARKIGYSPVTFDTTLRDPLMMAFFASIGFGASISLLKSGGKPVFIFFILCTIFAVAQNLIGILVALPFGIHPLIGVLAGSVTLTGGPATGVAFAHRFEEAGVIGAGAIALAAAMGGIVSAGIMGGPVCTFIINRYKLRDLQSQTFHIDQPIAQNIVESQMPDPAAVTPEGEDVESYALLKNLVMILVAVWLGSYLYRGARSIGIDFSATIGAMVVAMVIRNVDDWTNIIGLSQRLLNELGNVALSLGLVVALMTLDLLKLSSLAIPLIAILITQLIFVCIITFPIFKIMGKDYEAAVMGGGFIGFMMGIIATAMAVMKTIVERYGPAPKAFLIAPMVGGFFIDFTNALIITGFLNIWKKWGTVFQSYLG